MVAFELDASEGLAPLMVTSVPPGFLPFYGGTKATGNLYSAYGYIGIAVAGNPKRGDPMRLEVVVPSIWLRLVLPKGNVRATDGYIS